MNNSFMILLLLSFAFQSGWTNNNCIKWCNRMLDQVCGSDNVTYSNPCTFEIAQCEDPSLTKKNDGKCTCEQNCQYAGFRKVCGSD
ncbi:hypothetical protein SNEBB_002138, partial [Seison nebaliae]